MSLATSDKIAIDYISRSVCQLKPVRRFANGEILDGATCTGFFWRHQKNVSLITNWHCLTGLNPENFKPLGSYTPNLLRIQVNASRKHPEQEGVLWMKTFEITRDLFEDDEPLWLEHNEGAAIDLAVLPLPDFDSDTWSVYCLNDEPFAEWWPLSVASDCFLVGYPEGISSVGNTPIWKRGSIASEPSLDHEKAPTFLVDSLSNKGMSGSPVIAQSREIFRADVPDGTLGPWRRFAGVYSGRLGNEGVSFQLGRVWKSDLIEEILSSPKQGSIPQAINF